MKRSKLLLVAVPLIIVLACLLTYQRYSAVRQNLASIKEEEALKEKTLRKYLALIAERSEHEKKAAELKEQRKANDMYLMDGQTLAIVAATLQDTIKTIVTSHGGTITSERAGKTEEREAFSVINVTIDTVLPDARSLADVLYAIETPTPWPPKSTTTPRESSYTMACPRRASGAACSGKGSSAQRSPSKIYVSPRGRVLVL